MRAVIQRLSELVEGVDGMIKMETHFVYRTNRHISLVRKYCKKIEEAMPIFDGELIGRGKSHDDSKFLDKEKKPNIWLTWRYKCKDDGVECKLPDGMEEEIHSATEHHIRSNRHHPEFHQGRKGGLLNKGDRDKPPKKMVDATKMTDLDIAECVADWLGMAEERGNTPREWADKNVNIRWKFTDKQKKLIYGIIDAAWKDKENKK